jgi:hypothetical protein
VAVLPSLRNTGVRWGKRVRARPLNEKNRPISYQPLAEIPGLFLEFARLADEEIIREVWLDWIERYGVLGLEWDDLVRDAARRHLELGSDLGGFLSEVDQLPRGKFGSVLLEGGPRESYQNFVEEARKANGLLRLYEAVQNNGQMSNSLKGALTGKAWGIGLGRPGLRKRGRLGG